MNSIESMQHLFFAKHVRDVHSWIITVHCERYWHRLKWGKTGRVQWLWVCAVWGRCRRGQATGLSQPSIHEHTEFLGGTKRMYPLGKLRRWAPSPLFPDKPPALASQIPPTWELHQQGWRGWGIREDKSFVEVHHSSSAASKAFQPSYESCRATVLPATSAWLVWSLGFWWCMKLEIRACAGWSLQHRELWERWQQRTSKCENTKEKKILSWAKADFAIWSDFRLDDSHLMNLHPSWAEWDWWLVKQGPQQGTCSLGKG